MQKEFKQILEAINKWINANDREVAFIGNFISFDKKKWKKDKEADDITKDSITLGFGQKEVLKIFLEELQRSLKKEKEDFANWCNTYLFEF